jgi:predicted RNase H-like HicB family nuclease
MKMHFEFDREEDGRWIAEVPELPGVLAYGASQEEARAAAEALALRVIAERDALTQEFDNIIERVSEQVDDKELAERERKADEFIESVRARASRRERA